MLCEKVQQKGTRNIWCVFVCLLQTKIQLLIRVFSSSDFSFFIRLHTQTSLFMYYRHHTIFVFVGWLACYVRCNLQQSIWNVKIFCIFFFCNERMKNFEGEKMKSCMLWMVSMKTIRSKSKQKPTYMTFFRSCGQFFNFRWKNGLGLNIIYWSLTDFFYQNITKLK